MLNRIRQVLRTADATARYDLAFFRGNLRFCAAIAVFVLLPALYAVIYLTSTWDPSSLTRNLTVVLVNEDRGTEANGVPVNIGASVVSRLRDDGRFSYQVLADANVARHRVDQGEAGFALLIPPDFSQLAMEARQVGTARFIVHASQGNNSAGAGLAQQFAMEVSERVNQSINEQRFDAMLRMAGGSRASLEQLRQAVAQLDEGSARLQAGGAAARQAAARVAEGSQRLDQAQGQLDQGLRGYEAASRQLADGLGKAGTSVAQMRGRLPASEELQRLDHAAQQIAAGQRSLAQALREMTVGAARLRDGQGALATQAADIPFVGEALSDGVLKLRDGTEQLRAALQASEQAGAQLADGSRQLAGGVAQLTQGMGAVAAGLAQIEQAAPSSAALDQFHHQGGRLVGGSATLARGSGELAGAGTALQQGLDRLDAGLRQLREGVAALQASLPEATPGPGGTPAGLSESVKPALQFSAPVPNQGTAMAPNVVPLSLWVGATLCAVMFAYHLLPAPLQHRGSAGIVLGKLAVPAAIVIAQALVLAAVLVGVMAIHVAHPLRWVITLMLTALTFASMLLVLVRLFGNAGKLLAVILLAIQLAASGTMVPIELTSPLFQAMHPWLPLSWAIKAIRIAMFDAYEGEWVQSTAAMVAMLFTTLAVGALAGRWRVVSPEDYRPMVE